MYHPIRSHLGAVSALVVSILFGACFVGCSVKTSSIEKPGQRVTVDELNQEVARAQRKLDGEAADVRRAMELYTADVAQTQAQVDASVGEAKRKADERRAMIQAAPAIAGSIWSQVASGNFDPFSLIGNLFAKAAPLLALGASADAVRARIRAAKLEMPPTDPNKPPADAGSTAPLEIAASEPAAAAQAMKAAA